MEKDTLKMPQFKTVIQTHLHNFIEDESSFSGHIDGTENFEQFMNDIRATGFMFIIRHSAETKKDKLFFHKIRKDASIKIPFFGPLFQILKSIHYECSQGRYRNKVKKRVLDEMQSETPTENESTALRKRSITTPSKKVGCAATMDVSHIRIFPQYKIAEYHVNGCRQQSNMVKQLKLDLAGKNVPESVDRYLISVSQEEVHNHTVISSSVRQTLHPKLIAEINELIKKRVCSIKGIRFYLQEFVDKMNQESKCAPPHPLNRCYYPTDKIIQFHRNKALKGLSESELKSLLSDNNDEEIEMKVEDETDDTALMAILEQKSPGTVVLNEREAQAVESILHQAPDVRVVVDNSATSAENEEETDPLPIEIFTSLSVPSRSMDHDSIVKKAQAVLREKLKKMHDLSFMVQEVGLLEEGITMLHELEAAMTESIKKTPGGCQMLQCRTNRRMNRSKRRRIEGLSTEGQELLCYTIIPEAEDACVDDENAQGVDVIYEAVINLETSSS